ncbi:MAG: methionyl-tRNA formyltransferase [Endomicrobium sp.]|jgi:methionyl-tRNA formyltransferase|nr:methionyl-tRNA formyltransferase [Endomicrobium sp.]
MVKILFFGTASLSAAFLDNLYAAKHDIFCVTMPDKPASRGQKLSAPAVKIFAQNKGIPFIQPLKYDDCVFETLKAFNADAAVAVAYGKLIPQRIFLLPKHKTFNIHFSLLPKYRGAAPVQYALLNGETQTGVSSFYLEQTLDTGDIIIQKKMPIEPVDTAETLFSKLVPLGIEIMNETLVLFQNGASFGKKQEGEPSYTHILKKEDGLINWSKSAAEILNMFRGFYPWPGTYCVVSKGKLTGKRIKIIEFKIIDDSSLNGECGKIFSIEKNKGFSVLCAKGIILVTKIQPENKPVMDAWNFIQGGLLSLNDYL